MQHPYLQRHTQRTRLLWLLVAACVIGAALLLWSRPAGAHQATLTVDTVCQTDGTWMARWTISNSEDGKLMDIVAQDRTDLLPNPVARSGSATDATVHANSVGSVTANVSVDWVRHSGADVSATAHRPEVCQAPTTTVLPTTTTTLPPAGLIPPLVIERPRPAVPATPGLPATT